MGTISANVSTLQENSTNSLSKSNITPVCARSINLKIDGNEIQHTASNEEFMMN
jgi:hypothetical protein